MSFIDALLERQALELAAKLEHAPEFCLRSSRTETIWKYRPYEGGCPASSIDWRQSAKGREILTRGHEQITRRDVIFWANLPKNAENESPQGLLLLIVLAHLLVKRERAIGWLCDGLPKTQTVSRITGLFERGLSDPLCYHPLPLHHAFVLIATDTSIEPDRLSELVSSCAAQHNHGVILNLGREAQSTESLLHRQCARVDWPILSLKAYDRPELGLQHLFEKAIQATKA